MSKKRILFVTQLFYPEVFRGNDVAFHLAAEGHKVHVVTGIPNYPVGRYFDGYGLFKKRHEMLNGVEVTRLPLIPRGNNNKILLALNYFSFLVVACVWMLFHALLHKYDCVFVQQLSPVTMSAPGVLYKKIRKVPLYTWVLDLWPESLAVAGGIHNRLILGFFDLFVKSEYKNSDKILISSRGFRSSIMKYGNYTDKIIYYPQWDDGTGTDSTAEGVPVLPEGFIVMFAGAVGAAHGFECTLEAALKTKEFKNIKWVIVGDGRRLKFVRQFVEDNNLEETVLTMGRYPVEAMPQLFKQADVMLVTLKDDPLFRLYAPAKIASYMAAARPIIAVLNGEGGEVVKEANCGWHIPAGDADGLAKQVVSASRMRKDELRSLGDNGKAYYNENYEKNRCLERLSRIMKI